MDVGQPLRIVAVLGVVALANFWAQLDWLARVLAVLGVLPLVVVGWAMSASTGMASSWAERAERDDEAPG